MTERKKFEDWWACEKVWLDIGSSDDAWAVWQASRAVALESAAIAAWSTGMDEHNSVAGHFADAREVGSLAAQAIRALKDRE